MGERVVHEGGPEDEEHDVGAEPHALHDRARDQRRRDDREHQLEHGVRLQRNRGAVRGIGLQAYTLEAEPREPAPPGCAVPERDGVADQHPLHTDHAQRDDAHHHRVEGILGAHQSAIEKRQPHRHHHHQRGGGEDPGGIARRDGVHDSSSPATAPAWCALSIAARWTTSAFTAVGGPVSFSPVRIRITRSIAWTKILPSPTSPVRAGARMALMHGSTNGSEQTISILTFSWNSMTTVVPRYWLTLSCSPPWPLTRLSVIPVTPAWNSAALTSGRRSGRTMVVMSFIVEKPSSRETRCQRNRASNAQIRHHSAGLSS